MSGIRIVPFTEGVGRLAQFLSEKIRAFNDERSPAHKAAGAAAQIGIAVTDEAGNFVGGVSGETYWNWLEIKDLFLPEELRGGGLGRKLLLEIEDMARARGCTRSFLTTFSFQAPGFYEKNGYRPAGRLADYPPGGAYYWMMKELKSG